MSDGPKYGLMAVKEMETLVDALVEQIPAHPEILTASNPFELTGITGLPFSPDMSIAAISGLLGAARSRHKAAQAATSAPVELPLPQSHEQKYGGIW